MSVFHFIVNFTLLAVLDLTRGNTIPWCLSKYCNQWQYTHTNHDRYNMSSPFVGP